MTRKAHGSDANANGRRRVLALVLAASLATVAMAGIAAADGAEAPLSSEDEDTCALVPPDASDEAVTAERFPNDESCFGSVGRTSETDMRDWYMRQAPIGDHRLDLMACDGGEDGTPLHVRVYFEPTTEGRTGLTLAYEDLVTQTPLDGCDLIQADVPDQHAREGGTWFVELVGPPNDYVVGATIP